MPLERARARLGPDPRQHRDHVDAVGDAVGPHPADALGGERADVAVVALERALPVAVPAVVRVDEAGAELPAGHHQAVVDRLGAERRGAEREQRATGSVAGCECRAWGLLERSAGPGAAIAVRALREQRGVRAPRARRRDGWRHRGPTEAPPVKRSNAPLVARRSNAIRAQAGHPAPDLDQARSGACRATASRVRSSRAIARALGGDQALDTAHVPRQGLIEDSLGQARGPARPWPARHGVDLGEVGRDGGGVRVARPEVPGRRWRPRAGGRRRSSSSPAAPPRALRRPRGAREES